MVLVTLHIGTKKVSSRDEEWKEWMIPVSCPSLKSNGSETLIWGLTLLTAQRKHRMNTARHRHHSLNRIPVTWGRQKLTNWSCEIKSFCLTSEKVNQRKRACRTGKYLCSPHILHGIISQKIQTKPQQQKAPNKQWNQTTQLIHGLRIEKSQKLRHSGQ